MLTLYSQGNSMIRRHPGAIANLLRVTFVEEDLARLQVGRWGISSDFLHSHLYSTLTQSLDLCGRYFEFLA